MKNDLKLALIQMGVTNDQKASVDKAMENIDRLSARGANMIVLPEMFNCPYDTKTFGMYAEAEGGATWQKLSEAAAKNKVYLISGTVPETEGDLIFNTCYVFDPEGKQIGKHRKIHMFDIDIKNGQYFKESDALTAGNSPTIVDTDYGKVGIAVCYDVRFPELARYMTERGARILIYPASFNMTTGPVHWELLFRARAVDNQVFTVGCAPARDDDATYVSYGHSIVVSPWGDVLGALTDEEGFLMGTLDLGDVEKIRGQLPLIKHLRRDLYSL